MSDYSTPLDYIDLILYINLDHRTDRKQHILHEITKIDPMLSKVHRIDAVYNQSNGALGCTMSHIKALEFFIENTEWNNCIIFEDDFTFASNYVFEINDRILYLLDRLPNFDILLLSTGLDNLITISTVDSCIKKVISSQTASGYIINKKYAKILLDNFKESSRLMIEHGKKEEWCLDQYWKRLMSDGNWYTYKDRIGYQYENYSDIEKKSVNYNC